MANMSNEPEHVGKSNFRHVDRRGRVAVLTLHWAEIGGQLGVVSAELSSKSGVDATMWRDVAFATAAEDGREGMAKVWRMHTERPEISEAARKKAERVLAAARPATENLELLELVAATYQEAHGLGRPPTKAVHEELQRRGHRFSRQQVGKLVMRCRGVGLLGPAEQRKPGEKRGRK